MIRTIHYTADHEAQGCTVREFLYSRGYSRSIILNLKNTTEGILLNGSIPYLKTELKAGDILTVRLVDTESSQKIDAVPVPIHILYEDDDIMVLNKQADTPVHPSQGNYYNTLANGVAYYFSQKGENFIFRCINRLDRDTTGALILAKNSLSAALLSGQMQRREIHRTYLAIVQGYLPSEGTIDAPIARLSGSTIERCVDMLQGQRAVTHYRRLCYDGCYSLAELNLETGRTHQIRVHMKYAGTPLPGDFLYNPDFSIWKRQPLHSWKLEFSHPVSKEPLSFTAPLPADMHHFT